MAFWERNFLVIGAGTLLSALLYFGVVTYQSLSLGSIAPPSLILVMACVILQVGLSALGMLFLHALRRRAADWDADEMPPEGMDERDRFVKLKSEASSAHFYYLFFFVAMLGWFAHENAFILFHSLFGAFYLGDLARVIFQLIYYNKAY